MLRIGFFSSAGSKLWAPESTSYFCNREGVPLSKPLKSRSISKQCARFLDIDYSRQKPDFLVKTAYLLHSHGNFYFLVECLRRGLIFRLLLRQECSSFSC